MQIQTRIEPCREVCDVNAFKIATSLIITGGRAARSARGRSKMQNCIQNCIQNCMSAIGRSSQEELARAKVCSLDPRSSRSSQGLRPYKNLKKCIPRSSQGSVARAKALVEIMKITLLARARKASLERASESGFLKEFVFFPILDYFWFSINTWFSPKTK